MRNRDLHDALRAFALESAALLCAAHEEAGSELSFDVVEEGGHGPVLYRYSPLTREFIAERWEALRAVPTFGAAAEALGWGAAAWLRHRGADGADSEAALRAMLERLYEDASGFDFPEERFERVYAEVERTLYQGAGGVTVLAPMPGLGMEPRRVELGGGLALVAGDSVDAPSQAVWPERRLEPGAAAEPNVLCVLAGEEDGEPPGADARVAFRLLVRRLRLFKRGAVGLGPLGWTRAGTGAWQPVTLDFSHPGHGEPMFLGAAEAGELRELVEVCERGGPRGPVHWALARLDMACERASWREALSDTLLALGALLDASDDAGRASLPLRLSVLCAETEERRELQERVERALALERCVVAGAGDAACAAAASPYAPEEIAAELEGHLRALLRDVICGYLDPSLKRVADDLLLRTSEPLDIRAADLRDQPAPPTEPEPQTAPSPEPARLPAPPPRSQLATSPAAGEPAPTPAPEPQPDPPTAELDPPTDPDPYTPPPGAAVTASIDWGDDDEDPADYSAPV